jgi:hypothetical protein
VIVKTQYTNPAYAEAEARMLAASKALRLYKEKGYSEKHPYTQRAQAELDAAKAELATLDKYIDRERSVIDVSTTTTPINIDVKAVVDRALADSPLASQVVDSPENIYAAVGRALAVLPHLTDDDVKALVKRCLADRARTADPAFKPDRDLLQFLEEVAASQQRMLGEDHPDALRAQIVLAEARDAAGDLAQAEQVLRRALETARRTLGDQHTTSRRCLDDLVRVLTELGKTEEAAQLKKSKKGSI